MSLRPIRFLADVMLGTLAKWLRILGYDTVYDNLMDDEEIIRRCRDEDRIALTRDTRLLQRRRLGRSLFIQSNDLAGQVREVLQHVGHDLDPSRLLSLCVECNTPLVSVAKESVRETVPPYVFQTQTEFKRCPNCQKIYWGGTHRDLIKRRLQVLLGTRP